MNVASPGVSLGSCESAQVLVASTGVIGRFLPIDRICGGIEAAAAELARENHGHAMEAIMTTDTKPKEYAVEVETPPGTYRIGGMAKGSGMIKFCWLEGKNHCAMRFQGYWKMKDAMSGQPKKALMRSPGL